jgi:hypothetical protein
LEQNPPVEADDPGGETVVCKVAHKVRRSPIKVQRFRYRARSQ